MTNVWFDLAEVSVAQYLYCTVGPYTIHGPVLIILSIVFVLAVVYSLFLIVNNTIKPVIKLRLNYYKFLKVVKQECGDSVSILGIFHSSNSDSLLDSLISQKSIELRCPGVYAIHCLVTNTTYFCSTTFVLEKIECDLYKFENECFGTPQQLVYDYLKFGLGSFLFIIFTVYPDMKYDQIDQERERIETRWPFGIYSGIEFD